jgi:hypothetical protein
MELLHYPSIFSALPIITSSGISTFLLHSGSLETHKQSSNDKQADLDFLFLVSFPHKLYPGLEEDNKAGLIWATTIWNVAGVLAGR